jgi:hypothetical protein
VIRDADGQSSIELLGLLPLVLIVVLATAQLLAAGSARTTASAAAEAAAMAIVQGGDPKTAAHAATPGWAPAHLTVRVTGRHVRVRALPRAVVPLLPAMLASTATADAGPTP